MREKVAVIGYEDAVVSVGNLTVWLEFEGTELTLYPEESKALRKALKRAEERVKAND